MIRTLSSEIRIGVSRSPPARISSEGKAEREGGDGDRQLCGAERDRVFRAGEIAQAARDRSQPVGVGNDVVENLRRSASSMSGASTSSRSSSAAPLIDVSGDFNSCETWVAKVE